MNENEARWKAAGATPISSLSSPTISKKKKKQKEKSNTFSSSKRNPMTAASRNQL